MRRTGWTATVGIGLALASANCTSSTDNGGDDATVEDFKVQLEEAFTNNLAGFSNAIQRLGLAAGANFTLTGITGGAPQTASGSGVVTQVGPSIISITNGNFQTRTDTRGNDASVSGVNITADVSGGGYKVTGTADFEFNRVSGLFTFAPNGNWFKITVTGDSFDTFVIQ